MQNNNEQNDFTYTYSAKDKDEVRSIRDKYLPREESKLERLRRLDRTAESKATVVSLVLGILGTLILGLGMSFILSELSLIFESQVIAVIVGIILGIIGGAIVALAYPVYNRVLAKERERIAPEIIRLSDELMK